MGVFGNVSGVVLQRVLLAVTGSFNFGFSIAALNTSKDFISLDFKWCPNPDHSAGNRNCDASQVYGAFAGIGVFVGAIAGCLLGGKLTNFGRRTSMICMHCIFILGAIMSASAEGFASLFIARIVVGLGVGFSTVCVPMYISEVTPKESRGFYGVLHQLFITLGIFVAVLLGLALGEAPAKEQFTTVTTFQSAWWRTMLAMPILICVPAVILLLTKFTSETPHYMIEKQQMEMAAEFLQSTYGRQDVREEMKEITDSIEEAHRHKEQSLSVWSAIMDSSYTRVILIGCLLSAFQQMTGINVLMANSNRVYEASGLGDQKTKLSIGMTALNVLMTFPPIFFVDKLGRRTVMLIGTIGQAASLAPAMIANLIDTHSDATHYISVASTFAFVVFFAAGYGPVLWVYLHEIFPIEIKQGAASLASALNWLATIALVLPSDFLLTDDPTAIFCIFTVMGVIAAAIVFFFMKETKGLSIDNSPYVRKRKPKEIEPDDRMDPSNWEAQKIKRSFDERAGTGILGEHEPESA